MGGILVLSKSPRPQAQEKKRKGSVQGASGM